MTLCGEFRFSHRWRMIREKGGLLIPRKALTFLEERDRELEDFLSGTCEEEEEADGLPWFAATGSTSGSTTPTNLTLVEGSQADLSAGTDEVYAETYPGIWLVHLHVSQSSPAAGDIAVVKVDNGNTGSPFDPFEVRRAVGARNQDSHSGLIAIGAAEGVGIGVVAPDSSDIRLNGVRLVPGSVAAGS